MEFWTYIIVCYAANLLVLGAIASLDTFESSDEDLFRTAWFWSPITLPVILAMIPLAGIVGAGYWIFNKCLGNKFRDVDAEVDRLGIEIKDLFERHDKVQK